MNEPRDQMIMLLNNNGGYKLSGISTTNLWAVQLTGGQEDNGKLKVSQDVKTLSLKKLLHTHFHKSKL